MSRFRFGSLSGQSTRVITLGLVLFGLIGLAVISILIYAVPCTAAFKKTPAAFWRTFTISSILVATVATCFCTYGYQRETEGLAMAGFPFSQPVEENSVWSAAFTLNGLFASGLCLLPVGFSPPSIPGVSRNQSPQSAALRTFRTL